MDYIKLKLFLEVMLAVGTKVFSRVRNISIDGDSAGKITIGTEAVGYTLKVINDDNMKKLQMYPWVLVLSI